jgi:teichuronic acid biosynthesis glycosyltransferase TuaG
MEVEKEMKTQWVKIPPNEPLISVLINNYNKGKYLEECLQSVLDQTYTNWEIIFWDDNSTDDSWEIAENFEVKNKLMRKMFMYCTEAELGDRLNITLGQGRWLAVKKCDGKYIAVLDSDDKWDKDKLEWQIWLHNKHPEVKLTFTNMRYFGEDFVGGTFFDKYPVPKGNPFINLLTKYNYIPMSTTMVKRESLLEIMGESPFYNGGDDYNWWLRLLAKHNSCASLSQCLTSYRIVKDSLTHGKKQRIRAQWYEIDAFREALTYRKLSRVEKTKAYMHLVRLYCELIYKEIMEKL